MAAEIETEFGVKSDLEGGGSGIYDVVVDGVTLFSKHETGRFPEAGEIVRAIRSKPWFELSPSVSGAGRIRH